MQNQLVAALLGSVAVFSLYTYAFAQAAAGLIFAPNDYYGQAQTSHSAQSRNNTPESSYAYADTRRLAHSRSTAPKR